MGAVEQTGAGSSASVGGIAAAHPAPGMEGGCFEAGYGGVCVVGGSLCALVFPLVGGRKTEFEQRRAV